MKNLLILDFMIELFVSRKGAKSVIFYSDKCLYDSFADDRNPMFINWKEINENEGVFSWLMAIHVSVSLVCDRGVSWLSWPCEFCFYVYHNRSRINWTLLFNKNKDCKVEMVTTSNELPLCNNVEYCSFFRSSIWTIFKINKKRKLKKELFLCFH